MCKHSLLGSSLLEEGLDLDMIAQGLLYYQSRCIRSGNSKGYQAGKQNDHASGMVLDSGIESQKRASQGPFNG